MREKRFIGAMVIVALIGWALPGAAAPNPEQAQTFVQTGLDEAFEVLRAKNKTKQQKSEGIRVLMAKHFDVATVGKFALGVYRRRTNPDQMKAYLQAFEEFLVQVYVNRIVSYTPDKDDHAGKVLQVTGTRPASKTDIFVLSVLTREESNPQPIEWRVRNSKGRLAIIDVSIAGTSQALTYKQEFASIITRRNSGIDGLISELKEKNDRYRAERSLGLTRAN